MGCHRVLSGLCAAAWMIWTGPALAQGSDATSSQATQEAIDQLLMDLWDSPSDKVLSRGNATRVRAGKAGADQSLVNHAYAVLMLRHEQWDVAKGVLRKECEERPGDADAWLCALYENVNSGRGDLALKTLAAAFESEAEKEPLAMAVAVLTTFHQVVPLPKARDRDMAAMETKALASLPVEGKARYAEKKGAVVTYIGGLDDEREKRLQSLIPTRTEASRVALTLNRMRDQWQMMKNTYDQHTTAIAVLTSQIAQHQQRYQRLINSTNDQVQRARLANELEISITPLQNEQRARTAAAASLDRQARELTAQMKPHEQRLEQLSAILKAEEERIDRELAIPPLDVNPEQQREKLLGDRQTVLSTQTGEERSSSSKMRKPASAAASASKETRPSPGVSDERKAEGMLRNAELLYKAERHEAAFDKLRELIEKYPESKAASKAKKILEEAKANN